MTLLAGLKVIFTAMSLLSNYKVLTITHHNLNVNEISHFFLQKNDDQNSQSEKLQKLKDSFQIEECLYLETCNRVTFLLFSDVVVNTEFLRAFFLKVNPKLAATTLYSIEKFVSVYEGESAVRHVFEMASSMDSLVIGEREIFRQFRVAYEKCQAGGLTSDYLRILEKATVTTAKEVYHSTKIGEKALSIVSLAINALLKNQVSRDSRILLVGAGETNSLVGKFLKKYQFRNIKIYNRSLHNAAELSNELNAESYHIQDLNKIQAEFDIVIICTSANEVIIDRKLYKEMLGDDSSKKTIIDLAVPRNVSEEVVESNAVHYIDIEGLRKLSEANLQFRKKVVEKAHPIINKNLIGFKQLFDRRQIEKAMSEVPVQIAAIKDRALSSVYKNRIEELDENSKELLLEMMDYMEKKCVSVPMKLAKKSV